MHNFSLTQVVTEPTHNGPNGKSLIDLVLMSSTQVLAECTVIPQLANSDHLGLRVVLHGHPTVQHIHQKKRSIWRYAHADFDTACNLLDELDLDTIIDDSSIENSWSRWKDAFLAIMERCIPKAQVPNRKNLPWLTKEIVRLIRKRNYYYRRYQRGRWAKDQQKYKSLRNKVITMLRDSKAKFFNNLNPKSTKSFWSAVKYLNKQVSSIPTLVRNGCSVETDMDKADLLNSYFAECFNKSQPPLSSECYCSPDPESCPLDLFCTEEEIFELLAGIDTTKSNGPDGISGKMLKSTASSITPALTKLFNLSIKLGKLPAEWKLARVNPIPKQGSKSDPSNYRPISLLPVISKLMEKHIQKCLLKHLQEHSPISDNQWGFSKGKSTTGALLTAVDNWHRSLESGNDVCAVFFDLRKAFDSVPHKLLLNKLVEINTDPHLIKWIADYLRDREQYVGVNGASSNPLPVVSGVPQGSILGPLLFLIFIDGITSVSISNGSMLLYADDILLYRVIRNRQDLVHIQQDINSLHNWIQEKYLQFNASKCKYMLISRKRQPLVSSDLFTINNLKIEKVEHFKYLGVWLSSNLTWNKHIEEICKSASKQTGMIYRKFYQNSSRETLLNLYISLIRPRLEYAAPVWDPSHQTFTQAVEKVQRFALKMCLKNWSSTYEELLTDSKLPTLKDRRTLLKLSYLFQVMNGSFSFPNAPLTLRQTRTLRNSEYLLLERPIVRTNAYMYSYFPHVISLWNSLPSFVHKCTSLSSFKYNLRSHLVPL